jgi:CubicO group peptidase (beta-lactamase class C family)
MRLNRLKFVFFTLTMLFLFAFCGRKNEKKLNKLRTSCFVKMPNPNENWMKKARFVSDSYFNNFLAIPKFNGHFLVAKNAKIIFSKSTGFSNIEETVLLNDSTPIHVASISKVATALAVLRLCDQKKIHIDEEVNHYLDDFPFEKIRVRDLLTHRSGLPQYHYFSDYQNNRSKFQSNRSVLKLMRKHQLQLHFVPNTRFSYCNTNYLILALIVERVTRQKFPNAMKNLVFDPLEMKHTFILHKKSFFERISQSYSAGKVKQVFTNLDLIYGDKNMYTTAKDLFKMSLGTYSPKFLSTKMRKEMFQGYSWEKDGLKNYGLGIRMIEEPNSKLFYHTGWWHGNLGMLAMARKDTLCVIAISNIYNRRVQKLKPLIDRLKLI